MYINHGVYCYLLVVEISKLSQFLRHYMSQMQIFTTKYMKGLNKIYDILDQDIESIICKIVRLPQKTSVAEI